MQGFSLIVYIFNDKTFNYSHLDHFFLGLLKSQKIISSVINKNCSLYEPFCTLWPLKRQLFAKSRLFSSSKCLRIRALANDQTSWVYPSIPVQSLYTRCYVTDNKPVLSYLLLRLLPHYTNCTGLTDCKSRPADHDLISQNIFTLMFPEKWFYGVQVRSKNQL